MTRKRTEARASVTGASVTVNPKVPAEGSAEFIPTDEQIRSRAHEIYQARCDSGECGDELADWIAAECELKARGDDDRQTAPYGPASNGASQSWRPADHPVGMVI